MSRNQQVLGAPDTQTSIESPEAAQEAGAHSDAQTVSEEASAEVVELPKDGAVEPVASEIVEPAAPETVEAAAVEQIEDDGALGTPADAVIDAVTYSQQQALDTVEQASSAVLVGLTRVQREMAEFVSARVRADMETQQALLRCKSFGDVQALQTRFLRTAMDQYAAEASRLVRLGAQTVAQSLSRRA